MSPLHLPNPFRRDPETPSLKERGASLRAGLARIAQRPTPQGLAKAIDTTSPAPADPPPALAAACDWGAAHMAWINDTGHPDGEWPDDRLTAEIRRFDTVLARAADEPSQGIGDLAAKARAVLADWKGTLDRKSPSTSERALLTLLREVGALSPADVSPLYQDAAAEGRILAAGGIDHHDGTMSYCDAAGAVVRQPVARWVAFTATQMHSKVQAEIARQRLAANGLPNDAYEAWEARARRDLRADAVSALAVQADRVFEAEEARRQGGMPSAPAAATTPDPFLAALEAARAANAVVDAFGRRTARSKPKGWFREEQVLVAEQTRTQEIALATVPTTRAGQIALVDYMAELMGRYGMADGSPPDPDNSIWHSAYRTLSAALRAPIQVEAASPPATAAEHDLSKLTITQLGRLYETWDAIHQHIMAVGNAQCFWKDERRYAYNPAGNILDREYDRASCFLGAIAREIEQRQPVDGDDQHERLNVLVRYELECSGKIADQALLTELAAAWGAGR